ncbi:hypothetical protein Tco_1005295 [Tanacetum coccineum]|uniref:Uncharacterized protein n=1 Tax=Tanacetum coccineum TaxID=301880 RepID=A0ABQ5FGS9_9ASTR
MLACQTFMGMFAMSEMPYATCVRRPMASTSMSSADVLSESSRGVWAMIEVGRKASAVSRAFIELKSCNDALLDALTNLETQLMNFMAVAMLGKFAGVNRPPAIMLACQTFMGMFAVWVICLKCHTLRVGGQQQMPLTFTNHADASSVSNPAHVGDVPDSRDTRLPGQQKQSVYLCIRIFMYLYFDQVYDDRWMSSADVLSESSRGSQLQADDEDATRRFRGTNHTLIMCKEIPNVPGPLQAGTGECHAPAIISLLRCTGHDRGGEEVASALSRAFIELKTCNAVLLDALTNLETQLMNFMAVAMLGKFAGGSLWNF